MKKFIALFLFCIVAFTAKTETFIGATSPTNRLVVGTNEAIVIYRSAGDPYEGGYFQLIKDGNVTTSSTGRGVDQTIIFPTSPSALAGPCELVFTNQALMHFYRIPTSSIQTVVLPPSVSAATVSVASGQTIRVFRPFPTSANATLQASRGTNSVTVTFIGYTANEEFTGPITLTFSGVSVAGVSIWSYVITDAAQIVPQGVTVQSPTGAFQLELEKSTNLTNWVPAVIQTLREDQKAYYRLRITK